MIHAWLIGKALGAARWIWIIGLLAVVMAGYIWLSHRDSVNRNIGATTVERDAAIGAVEQGSKANEAAEIVRRNGGPDNDQCLQDARNPEDC